MLLAIAALAVQTLPPPTSPAPLLPSSYSLLCQGDQATGFDWRANNWVQTNFIPEQRILARRVDNDCLTAPEEDANYDTFVIRHVCLNERKVGDPYYKYVSQWCIEYYNWRGARWDRTIDCKGSDIIGTYAPDGLFQRSSLHSDVSSTGRNGAKDSLTVEVGRCSLLTD
jgi:hypothetical protein